MTFDYTASAELFIPKNGKAGLRQPVSFRRFATAAEAIRFAVEDFPAIHTLRAWMRVGDGLKTFCRVAPSVRFNGRAIFAAGVFFRASPFNVRTCSDVQARRFPFRFAIASPSR